MAITTAQDLRELREELQELRGIISREAKHANGRFEDAKDDLRVVANNAGATIRELASRGKSTAVNAYEQYETTVTRHPVTVPLGAFLGGLFVAALMSRR